MPNAAAPALLPITPVKGLGAAFAAVPRLVGTAQGKMQAGQMAWNDFLAQLPDLIRVYEYNHPSAYQQQDLALRNATLQNTEGYDQARIGIETQTAGTSAENAATSAARLALAQQTYDAEYGPNGINTIKTAISTYNDYVNGLAKNYQEQLDRWKAANPTTGIKPGSAPPAPPAIPSLQEFMGGSYGTTPPTKTTKPTKSTGKSGGKKNPLGL